jgi:glycerophosphoryl diester phosphodiesterase
MNIMIKYFFLAGLSFIINLPVFSQSWYLIAHRGGIVDSTNVENSLPALEGAIKKGYQMVEMDVRLTKDDVLIIQHDRNFKRYYGVDSNAADMNWEQISQLVSNKGSKVVSLEEEFKNCQGKIDVMLDNKIGGNDTLLWTKLISLLKKYNLQENALMIGTDESTPWFTGKIRLSCSRQQLEENIRKPGYNASDYYLFAGVNSMTAADVSWANQLGIMVVGAVNMWSYKQSGTGTAIKDIETLKSWGVKRFQIDSELDATFQKSSR